MTNRRGFFKEFIGQVGVLLGDLRGVENIPLNRLNELPEDTIEQIVPIFFPDEDWDIQDGEILLSERNGIKEKSIPLSDMDHDIINLFKQNISLKQVAQQMDGNSAIPLEDIYQNVTSLFFRLASLRICHPKEIYKINEILSADNQ